MKLDHKFDEVLTSGIQTEGFTIEMNSVAFHALIDGIYSDKIAAPLRELSTNARDAHVMNGNPDRPFEVTLPSRFDPTLRVRDYGCSMTDEFVMSVYKTMFASNKRDSNAVAGAFGLGKMTPLSYSQQFQLTCWLDGRQRSYVIFIGDSGVPDIAKVYDEPSSDPQGVEVSFAVKDADIHAFQEKAIPILQGFDPLPLIMNEGIDLQPLDPIYEGTNWRLVNIPMKGVYARQGGVIYPVDMGKVDVSLIGYSSYAWRGDITLILDFEIGDLAVTTAREALSYDEKTIAALNKAMGIVVPEFQVIYDDQIKAATNYLQACITHSKISEIAKPLVGTLPGSSKMWGDEYLRDNYHTAGHFGVNIAEHAWDSAGLAYRIGDREYSRQVSLKSIQNATFIYTKPNVARAIQRVRRFLKEDRPTNGGRIYWIRTVSDLERLQKFELPVKDISDLEPLPLPRSASPRRPSAPRQPGMSMWYVSGRDVNPERATFEADEYTLFVDTQDDDRTSPILRGQARTLYDLGRMREYALGTKLIDPWQKVVFLTERLKERLTVDWKNQMLEKVVERKLREHIKTSKVRMVTGVPILNHYTRGSIEFLARQDRRRDPAITSILKDFQKWDNLPSHELMQLAKVFEIPVKDISAEFEGINLTERLHERLPLLRNINSVSDQEYYLRLERVIR